MDKLRVAVAQLDFCVGDIKGNTDKIVHNIDLATEKRADVVCFPELSVTGYPPEDLLLNSSFVRQNLKALDKIKMHCSDITAVVGFADQSDKLYNAAALISGGEIMDIYRKHHLPNYGVFDEKRYFTKGNKTKVYELDKIRFGVNICEDIWIKGNPTKKQSLQGDAQIIINISSSPYHASKVQSREQMLRQRANNYCCYVVFCNLTGGQDELVFDGHSAVIDYNGHVMSRAAGFNEQLLLVDIPVSGLGECRVQKSVINHSSDKPVFHSSGLDVMPIKSNIKLKNNSKFRSTLISFYGEQEEIFKALVLGTRDYVTKNGFKKVVIGLSGGIDSSLVAAIAVEAIGADNVTGVLMPSEFSSEGSVNDSLALSKNLGIDTFKVPINSLYDLYNESLSEIFKNKEADITEENLQARIRGNILMALSNKFGWLVLTTANKSETSVGYSTLYGDMAGGFAVIKDVPKTIVYKLCRYFNDSKSKEVIPESVLTKPPSAELRPDQKDTDSLPPYDVLDPILKAYIEQDLSLDEITGLGYNKDIVKRIIRLVDLNEYKRRQAAPGVKITPRAFGRDRRFPITNGFRQ